MMSLAAKVSVTIVRPGAITSCVVLAVLLAATRGYSDVRIELSELVGEYCLGGEEPWLIPSSRAVGAVPVRSKRWAGVKALFR